MKEEPQVPNSDKPSTRDKLSLAPLSLEDALRGAMAVPPPPKDKKPQPPRKRKSARKKKDR